MRLFNRLVGGLQNSGANKENNHSRGRNDEGTSRAKSDKQRNLSTKKLGLEALEERQLLSVNPVSVSEYDDIRQAYANLELPASMSQINVIAVDDLSAAALQAAVDQAAQTESDDLILLRTTADNYVVNLESTAVTVNIDSEQYGKLTIVGKGEQALTIETVNSNAFTVLNGDFTMDGAVIFNYSTDRFTGEMIFGSPDAKITQGETLVIVSQVAKSDPVTGDVSTTYLVDRAATPEEMAAAGVLNTSSTPVSPYRTLANPSNGGDDYVAVRNAIRCVLRTHYDYFGYSFRETFAPGVNRSVIYDAECVGDAGWLGTVANMLAYTGWAQQAGFSTSMTLSDGSVKNYASVEDAVVDYLRNVFISTSPGAATNYSITAASILDYLFAGNDKDCFGSNYSALTNTVEGGGFFPEINFGKVGGYVPASDSMLQDMLRALRDGHAITMEVETTSSTGYRQREYLSVWGYVHNPSPYVFDGGGTNGSAATGGLICSNPSKGSLQQIVRDSRYNNIENNPRTFYYHYVESDSVEGDNYNTYHTYLLSGSGTDLQLVHAPVSWILGDNNEFHFPEGFSFYGAYNQVALTYTSRIVGFTWLSQYTDKMPVCEINQNEVLALESLPGNTENVLYLHFAGVAGTGWDGRNHPQLNLDGVAGYGVSELKMIEEVWRRVSEDYAPFNVNVTTNANVWNAAAKGVRCVIGGYNPSAGGLSYVGVYGPSKQDNYVYPFSLNLNAKSIAEAASHEIGHTFGLGHDGYEHNEYYTGENSAGWAPIMGAGYHQPITQWSNGDYVNATNFQDDVAIIASYVGFRSDQHGDSAGNATDLGDYYINVNLDEYNPYAGTYRVESVIETREDADVFSFTSYGGTYVVDVSGDGADHRFIDSDFAWNYRRHADVENPVFAGKYYAKTYDYTNLNLKVSMLDEFGQPLLLDLAGAILKLGYGERTRAFYSNDAHDSNYHFYVVDQFGVPVYLDDAKTILKEGYYAVDDSVFTTFSHFVTPELEAGKTYYIKVEGVGQGSSTTNGYSDYGSLGQYTLALHESYENFRIDVEQMDVTDLSFSTAVDNVLNWKEAFVYSGRRLEDGSSFLGNTLRINESLANTTITLNDALTFSYSRGIVKQPWAAKRFVLDATPAWDTENNQPGVTLDAQEKFRTLYVDNTTLEIYGFIITNGVASRGTSASQVNNGGGVYNHNGWLTIGDSIISGNRALKAGGGIYNAGGEYENTSQHDGWLYLINTSVVGNIVTEDGAVGGGIFNESGGVLTMVNTTVAGNTAGYSGGGIQNFGIINAYNSIIAKNYAAYGADVYTIYQQGTTNVRATIIGDESRNARLEAYRNGVNSIGDARSYIGNSLDGTVSSPVTTYDPEFISYRDYSMGDWSAELWKFWNLRLVGDSLAVNLGVNENLSTSLDFTQSRVRAYLYPQMGNTRFYRDSSDIDADLAGQNRIEDSVIDAGAYEVLAQPDLTQFVPTSAGSDVVNNWENSIVVSRAIDDQTGSVAPFLVNEPLYLNLGVINQGAAITSDFDITVYMWKYDPYTSKADMYANSVQGTGLPIMNVKVEFPAGAAMPGGTVDAVVTCTNLALGTTNTFTYDGLASYLLLENVAMGSVEEIVAAMIASGQLAPQNEEGYFVFGYAIDSNDAIAEYRETNNFFRTSSYFDVVESPVSINDSIVVTTTDDVVDPYDGEISLREAVEIYAGSFYYAEIALQDGDVFQANGVTYNVVNGKFYVDNTVPYQVYPGEQFTLADSNVITYVVDVFYNDADQAVNVPDGTVATVNGLECTLSAGVWTRVEETARYTRDDVQAQGSFTMANGDVVTVVNGVFRREMTHDVAIVPDGSVVTLATGEIAVYDFAQDRFIVTETTSFVLGDGDTIIVGGETLTLVADSYLDAANTRYYLLPGTQVTLSNGFPVTYDGTNFVYNTAAVSSTKLAAGTTVLLNGEEYSYKAGRALVKRVSRESNTVVFDPSLGGATFDLTQGPLTLDKSFTLDCVDWNGNQLDLTITSQSADPCLFLMLESADVTIMNFKFEGATSDEEGSILENYGKLTVSNVTFRDNVAEQGNLIFNASGATLNVEGSTFENNEAQLSALIYNLGSANINGGATFTGDYGLLSPVYSKGILTVEETVFTSTSGENGGAIHNDGGTVVIARSEFKTTSADNHGGAIYNVGDADLSVYDTTFDGTISALDGGAIFNAEGAKLVTEASIFKNIAITGVGGAIFNAGAFEDKDSLFENNSANAGAAIYTLGSVSLDGSTFKTNSAQEGGAIYAGPDSNLQIIGGSFFSNAATNGAAIYASGQLYASNSLFAKNTATNLGGAIYAASTTTFVNVTIADNKAADGAGFYNAGTATFDNSIIAGNTATGSGYDLYTEEGATTTLRSSLLGNIAQYGPKSFDTVAAYRSLLGVNPELNADYTLKGTSAAINAGSNDLENAEFDLAGNARRVGLAIGGAVRTVDMGALEYQTIIAPDLAIVASSVDYWGAEVIVNNVATELGYFIAGKDVSINFNVQNIGDARVIDNFGFNVKLVGVDSNGNTVYDQTLPTQYYATDFVNHNWLNVADWIAVNGEATMMTNFGSLPAGLYTVTVTLDVNGVGVIFEYGEEDGYEGVNNNVFEGSFNVFSEPSTVVTTENDVIDPVDGETSLREAIAAAGDYQYVSTYLVADGTTFTLENGEVLTVVNGWLTQKVDVVVKNGVTIDLVEGDEFLLNGRPIYYHYQMNGGYFTYGVGADTERVPQSALSSGAITYPDGTSASFQLQTSQYIHFVEDSDLNPQEGTHYTYNVLKTPNGDVVLTNGMEFEYSNVKFTYYQNETYPKGAFVFEDGNVVEYADGANLQFASLAIGSLSTRNARVEKSVQLADGSTLEVKNGVAKIFKEVDANVTFHKTKVQNKTIIVDPAQGPVVIDKTTVLLGSDIMIERELAILGEDRNVTVSGNDAVNMFLINADTVASISDLTMTKGYAKVGGALINRGELNLNNIKFVDNEAYWIKSASSGEHLVEGLGGAIANYGFLTVDGGSFTGNHATDFGGAIFANTAGETVVKNAAFSNNTAFAGGAIANQSGGLTVENTTFSSNSAQRAGAIYTLDDLTVVASVFTGNKAIAEDFASRNVVGGAIYASKDATLIFAADPNSESTVAVTFDGNVAESGGAVYAETGFQVTGDLVATNNVANASQYVPEVKGDYGAIFADGAVNVSGNLTMTGNTADGSYGALYAKGVGVGGSAVFSNNAAGGDYGAAYSQGAMNIGGNLTANNNSAAGDFGAMGIDGALTVGGNAEISGNTAETISGVRANSVAVTGDLTVNNNANTTNSGALVSKTSIKVDGSATANNNVGGALIAKTGVTVGGDASFENNASDQGAAINAGGAVLVNGAVTARGNVAEAEGGAIYANSFEAKGALVAAGNQAGAAGGAVYSKTYVKIGEGSSNISGNKAGGNGGAIYAVNSVNVAGDAVVATNVAGTAPTTLEIATTETIGSEGETIKTTVVKTVYSALGGAIYVAAGGAEFGGDVLFNKNKAGGLAGALYAKGGVKVAGDASFTNNSAEGYVLTETTTEIIPASGGEPTTTTTAATEYIGDYGAAYVNGALEIGGIFELVGNTASGSYGGMQVVGDVTVNGDVEKTYDEAGNEIPYTGLVAKISSNTAGGSVGAIKAGGALTIAGKTEIANNEAGSDYGAVKAASVAVTGDANITGNTAGGKFGAIFADSVSITGNVNVTDNKAENVGAIFAAAVSIGGDANITGNTADVKIGAILASSVSIGGDANVTGNTAGEVGAIAATSALTIGGSATIANNTARDSYGAILAGSVSIGGDANIAGNKAGENVGAIDAKSFYVGANATITGNKAANDVGAIRVTGTGDAFKIVGDAVITGNVVGTTPKVATTETTDVVNSTNDAGAPVRATTTVKTTTTTVQGKYGAFEVANGSAVFGASANISDNKASEFGAFYVAKNFSVAGDLTLERNVANGTETVVTETTTLVEVLNADGAVVSSTTNTETTTATNDVSANYGAGQVGGAFNVTGNAAINANKANDSYGAIHANTVTVSGKATITGNAAVNNAGAIYANSVNLNNALVANNKAGEKAGAIYANTVKLVNVTVAGNAAFEGGALYILGSAAIDNSILAGNSVTTREIVVGEETQTIAGSGVEIFAATGATIKLRNSLLQNAESTGAVAFDSSWMDAAYRCFVNVDPKFVNAAGGDYSLSTDSPAINTASNALAVAGVVTDLAGNDRYVGVDIGGVIYSIDMGAYEYQVVITADLAFGENPINFWYAKVDGQITDHYIVGHDVVLDYSITNSGDAAVFDKFNITFTVEGVTATGAAYSKTTVGRYQPGSDFFDWLKNSDRFGVGATQSYARQNLGALPVGEYTITVTLDSGAEIVESISDNNVYTASFAVFEAPSVVVNSAADGAYNPFDNLVTLREASEVYVGPYWYGSRILLESGQFVRDDLVVVTVEDGVATAERNVLVVGGYEVDLADGQAFEYGSTYITFNNNVFTYPDGTQVAYAPGPFQNDYSITLTLADGTNVTAHRESRFDYLESLGQAPPLSTKYEYVDVFEAADGTKTLLSDLQPDSIAYSKTYATYRAYAAQASTGEAVVLANGTKIVYGGVTGVFMNGGFISDDGVYKEILPDHIGIELVGEEVNTPATYLGPTFTFEDGTFIEFVAGVSVTLESGLVIEMATRRDAVTDEFTTVDGIRYDFANDGSVWVSAFVGNEITFSDALVAANAIITLDGAEITPARDQSIVAATDANGNAVITVDAGTLSRVMSVVFGRVVELANMDFVNGRETTGGAIHNAGTLELTNVSVFNSTAYTEAQVDPNDKILLDGFGGAIYNSGALTVNGGSFSENQAAYFGGAIYSIGALEVDGARFDANASNYFGGAVYFQNSNATITSSIFENNLANYNGGAIAAAATSQASNLTVVNSLLANNSSANAEGGAIYAIGEGAVMTVSLVNDTIADNTAAIGGGVALDNAQAEVKNSIIARNVGSYQGGDLAIQQAATVVLYASLLGDGENVVTPEGLSVADGFSAFVGTTANPVNPRFGADYKLASTSPAVNTGVNSFIEGIEKDVYGGDRIVSEYVDLGAVESRAGAPDLAFDTGDVLAGWYSTVNGVSTGKFVEGWDVCFDYLFGNYGSGVVLNSFNYTITIDRLDADGNVVEGASKVFTRTYGDNVNGYMSEAFWLEQNETVSGYWNLGLFDAGHYQATITLDVNDTVFESSNDNNAYTTTFEVAERPSLVVTTELDVVDRYDGLVSLREAIAAVGSETTSAISMVKKIEDGATFALAPNAEIGAEEGTIATYANGAITFVIKAEEAGEGEEQQDDTIVALAANVAYALANGETFVWNGADLVTFTSAIADTITFHPTVFGKTIVLVDGELVIDRDMVISVSDGETVMIDAQSASRIFFVAHGDVRIGGLTLVNAKADVGAAIYNAGNLSVTNVAINSAEANSGAGVYNAETATLDLFNLAFADMNAAQDGGAVYNAGSLVGNLVSFNGSTATDGAAIYNTGEATLNQATFRGGQAADQAGAIYNADGTLVVTNSTFDGNTAVYGGAIVNYQGDATITASSFANNEASGGAGAIDNYGALNLTDVVFNSNKTNGFGGAIYNSMSSAANPYVITLSGVEFLANVASKGGAIYNAANSIVVGSDGAVKFGGNVAAEGAAIYNVGAIDASSAWSFEGNSATGSGGALYNAAGSAAFGSVAFISNSAENGAAVYNASTFKATNGNFRSNRASGSGAALYNARGTATISNTVMWLNEAAVNGGAIAVDSGSVTARNVTIAANSAAETAGGVYNKGTFKAYNVIVASNYAAEAVDLYAATTTTYFYNSLIGSTVGVNKTPTTKNVKTGDAGFAVAPIFAGGRVVNNPDLTLTAGSAAVNAGLNAYALDANGVALVYDLAGNDRICTSIDAVDMGAFEFPFEEPSATVTTNLDVEDPTDGVVSLREAISYAARLGETTVTFDPSVTNVILNSTLYIDSNVVIGNDAQKLTLESSGFNGSVVVVGSENDAANVTLLNIDIARGGYGTLSDNPDNAGGGARNYATLTLDRVGLYNNVAAYGGGAYNAGTMTIIDSEIVGNSANYYGGVYNRGQLFVNRTTIADNSAVYYGGGIGTYTGATVANSLVIANRASLGAGVYAQVNMVDLFNSDASYDVNLVNSTIVGNTATGAKSESIGAGVWANHVLNVRNSILYGNNAASADDLYATTIMATSKTTLAYSNVGSSNIAITGAGVKSVDPEFIGFDPATEWTKWDLGLQIVSKMINAGHDPYVVGTLDVHGNQRIASGRVDMGAIEEQGNVAPTTINVTLTENILSTIDVGSVVAVLNAVDANEGDTFTYDLLDNAGGAFALDGNNVVVAMPLAAGDYRVTARATDSGGAFVDKTFTIVVTDPAAPNYEAPIVTFVGRDVNSNLVVEWTTTDPAKEYVVEYRVKGDANWTATAALTGTFGLINEAGWQTGDVVEVRIKALASSAKNESAWSDVAEYTIAEAPASFNVEENGVSMNGSYVAVFEVVSNSSAYAYWMVDWNDGTTSTYVGLGMSRVLSHWYQGAGVYNPVLFVDNSAEGFALGTITVTGSGSGATLDLAVEADNVFSTIEPIATDVQVFAAPAFAAAAILDQDAFEWNAISGSVSVKAENSESVALVAEPTVAVAADAFVAETTAAAFAEFGSFEMEVDAAADLDVELSESVFDADFLNDLFEN